jgi:hypothetical protein
MDFIGAGEKVRAFKAQKRAHEQAFVLETLEAEVSEKKAEVAQHYHQVVQSMDEQLDTLALKIFREIRDEMEIEYKRL